MRAGLKARCPECGVFITIVKMNVVGRRGGKRSIDVLKHHVRFIGQEMARCSGTERPVTKDMDTKVKRQRR